MASNPDPLKSFKNFAMSQSPPSYSPMRRRESQQSQLSQSSPESGNDEQADVADVEQTGSPQENLQSSLPEEETGMDEEEEHNSEEEIDEEHNSGDEQAKTDLATMNSGVSVLRNSTASTASSSAPPAAEGDEADEGEADETMEQPVQQAEDEDADEGEESVEQQVEPAEDGNADEGEVSEDEPQGQQPEMQPMEQEGSEDPEEDAEMEQEQEETQQQMSPAPVVAERALVPVGAPVDALVPVDEAENPSPQIIVQGPRSPNREAWGALPEEAKRPWTVHGDSCSLEVGGNVLKLPRAVYDRLFVYQRQGVAWLWNLYQKTFGGILADEMGLGKTVQIAAFLACVKCSDQGSRFLVVCPPTLLEQWKRELKSWASETGLAVHVMHGTQQERRTALRGMLARQGVMLTTYDLTRNCIDHLRAASLSTAQALLPKKRKKQVKRGCRDDDSPSEAEEELPAPKPDDADRPWDVVVVDEGHQIKNPSCLVGRALRKLESRCRFLLTGTPLQNKLSDLWALMDFAQPGLLGNHATFERNFSEQIAKGSKRNATQFAVELKDHLSRELRRLTAPHFLRRLKDEVLKNDSIEYASTDAPAPEELPTKTDVVLWLNLTNAQVELYNMYLSSETVRRATSGRNGMEALRAIALLKKLTNHPLLCLPKEEFNDWRLRTVPSAKGKEAGGGAASSSSQSKEVAAPDTQDGYDDDAVGTQPAEECQDFLARLRALLPASAEGASLLSCKLRVLSVLLPQLQKRGHRCLIFSYSTRMLDLIQACVLRVLGLKFLRIDGTIEPKDRDLKLGKFQAPDSRYFCMCLSAQVGGVGLTITGADRVILTDPAWNPAMDAQAIDRVHRIGQDKEVVVYRLIGSGAIEDKMFRLQVFKKSLAKTAMEQESQLRFFTNKDLKQLFEPPNQSTSTQSIMAEQLGTEALEHEDLLSVVANDIGSTDDPDAIPFWQSSDVLGFSDYQRLFMYLEQVQKAEEEAGAKAQEMVAKLRDEEYKKDQVVTGKWRPKDWKEQAGLESKENVSGNVQDRAVPLTDG